MDNQGYRRKSKSFGLAVAIAGITCLNNTIAQVATPLSKTKTYKLTGLSCQNYYQKRLSLEQESYQEAAQPEELLASGVQTEVTRNINE